MILRVVVSTTAASIFLSFHLICQQTIFPYDEKFDSVTTPTLPSGWSTTSVKSQGGDFTTIPSTPLSVPNALISTDSKVTQSLTSPAIDFSGKVAGLLQFYERRTSTHNSGIIVEASVSGDTTFALQLGDTLRNSGSTNYILRSIQLPSALNNQPHVRFRWRVVGNGTGSTGTVRLDNVMITVQKVVDLALTGMQYQPAIARSGDNVSVRIGVVNRGLGGTYSFILQLFDDKNVDSLLTLNEKIDEQLFTHSFVPSESVAATLTYPTIKAGNHRLVVRLNVNADEDTTNNNLAGSYFVGYPRRAVIVNEIMYAPSAGPEWVECMNNSSDTLSLAQWKIGDNTASRTTMTSLSIRIPPTQFFIITKDSSLVLVYPAISAPIIKTSFPTLNNDLDAVVIADPTGFAVDSVAYNSSWGGTSGRSLERIDTAKESNQPANWGTSRNPAGATPGAVNSLTKKEFDLSLERVNVSTPYPTVNESFDVVATLKNIGTQPEKNILVRFYRDANRDSLPNSDEIFAETAILRIEASDSATVMHTVTFPVQEDLRVVVTATPERDDDTTNNSRSLLVAVGVPLRSIVINEIMYAPPGDMPEWIELYNAGPTAVDIGGWKISDSNVNSKSIFCQSTITVASGEYFLVAVDSTLRNYFSLTSRLFVAPISSLNNTTPDAVVLFDGRGATMDSVWYKPQWGGTNGRSLERIDCFGISADSSNWKNSLPTPGAENSVARKDLDLSITSVGFFLIADGIRLNAAVRNIGRSSTGEFTVRLYHDADRDSFASSNELIRSTTVTGLAPGDSTIINVDWRTSAMGKIPVICIVDYPADQRPSNNSMIFLTSNKFHSQSAVINEVMLEPLPNMSEFIELYNRSTDTLDLQEWKIMDAASLSGNRSVVQVSGTPLPIPPDSYLVIAADSTLASQFSPLLQSTKSRLVVANKSLSLNNTSDDIILVDQTGSQIDSVRYSSSWHNPALNTSTAGRSLERVNPGVESNDRRNWGTSVAVAGATPGQRNSIYTPAFPTHSSMSLSPNPFSPDDDGFEDLLAISYSLPASTSMVRVRCFDVVGRLIRTIANNEPVASSGTIFWNGRDDQGRRARVGMYVVLFEALDASGGVVHTIKDVAVVATRLSR